MVNQRVRVLPDQFAFSVAQQRAGGRVGEDAAAFAVDAVNAFADGIENGLLARQAGRLLVDPSLDRGTHPGEVAGQQTDFVLGRWRQRCAVITVGNPAAGFRQQLEVARQPVGNAGKCQYRKYQTGERYHRALAEEFLARRRQSLQGEAVMQAA